MKLRTSLKVAVAVTTALGLTVGFGGAGVASAIPYSSYHHHKLPTMVIGSGNVTTNNNTSIKLTNNNPQYAVTGSATVESKSHFGGFHQWGGGSGAESATAESGTASNVSAATASVTVSNSQAAAAALPEVPNGVNVYHSGNTTTNTDTDIYVTNNNFQTAKSGDATVEGNVEAGSATSGAASNTSTTSFTISVSN